ncbi:hypothetical protein [Bacillus cereus]|uniref:hypothetical protein n=1 Tax=Bacillus cereus TaxID=1396 RepID=UPI0005C9F1AA|nr:hypothetical protein [Bacillus cereus]KIZ27258.1 hypothetical protein SK30_27015 [Bacillus cereus]
MADIWTSVAVPLGVALVPSILTYLGTRNQTKSALKTAQAQHTSELQKLKEQQKADLEKIKEQQQVEIQKMKEQQNAELQRMREQTLLDIEKMKFEMEKQIENYEKTAQVDVTKDIFTNMMMGDSSAFGNIATGLEELGKLQDQLQQIQNKSPKNNKHPANKRR